MSYFSTQTDTRGVTTITLDRPDNYNAMNREFIDAFTATLDKLRSNTRILVIAANGKHFCSGADVNWMKQSVALSEEQNINDAMALSDMLEALNTFATPTIAKVHGAALGGGTGLVSCCDIVVAAEDARFSFSEVRLGIIPATISPYALAAIGKRAARRYFLTGEQFDVLEAYRLGLVHDVCSTDNLDTRVEEKITSLMCCGPKAQIEAKKLITDIADKPVDTTLRQGLAARLASIRTGSEAQEALSAFLEKRTPNWD